MRCNMLNPHSKYYPFHKEQWKIVNNIIQETSYINHVIDQIEMEDVDVSSLKDKDNF